MQFDYFSDEKLEIRLLWPNSETSKHKTKLGKRYQPSPGNIMTDQNWIKASAKVRLEPAIGPGH